MMACLLGGNIRGFVSGKRCECVHKAVDLNFISPKQSKLICAWKDTPSPDVMACSPTSLCVFFVRSKQQTHNGEEVLVFPKFYFCPPLDGF